MKGIIISGKFSELLVRQKHGEEFELGELLIAEGKTSKMLFQVYDLLYGSQLNSSNLELASGMKLEEENDLEFMDEKLRNYNLAMLKNLITLKNDRSSTSKSLPDFFSQVREVKKDDLLFLTKPKNPLFIGNLRSGSKVLDVPIYLEGDKAFSHHILIPATTGRGKSLDENEEVILIKDNHYFVKPIGEIVNNSSIFEGSKVVSMNPKNFTVEYKKITKFVKHDAPKVMYQVITSSGREITVTGDHNLFVLRNGRLLLLKTENITKEDYIPIPLRINEISNQAKLNLFDLLKNNQNIYVLCNEIIINKLKPKKECINILSGKYISPSRKYHDFIDKKNKIEITKLLQLLNKPLSNKDLENIVLTDLFETVKLPAMYPLTKEFLELLGYYISEGYSLNENAFRISASEKEIQTNLCIIFKKLGLKCVWITKKGLNCDVGVSSSIFTKVLKKIGVGNKSDNKRLPVFFLNLSNSNLRIILKTYFEGDGGVDRETTKINKRFKISAVTKSKNLANDLCLALLKFSVFAQMHRTWKKATNAKAEGNWYYRITISGRDNLNQFLDKIGFQFNRKNIILQGKLNYNGNTNVDLIPVNKEEFIKCRLDTKLSQKEFSKKINYSQQIISLIELGKRRPSRSLMKKIILQFKNFKIFSSLMNFRWDQVAKIEKIRYNKKYVYDLTIEDNHTFLAGTCGLFVHNSNLSYVMLWNLLEYNYAGVLVLDPHDEYYGRNKFGLKDHQSGNAVYFSPNPPAGGRTLKINLNLIAPQHFNGVMDWSSAQKEALTAYYRKYEKNWIEAIVMEKEINAFQEGTIAVVRRRMLSLLDLEYHENKIYCNGIFDSNGGENTIADITKELEKGKVVIVDTSSFSGSVEILIGSLIATEIFNKYRNYKNKGELNDKPVISIFLEEAPRVLGKEILEKGSNIFATIAREGRKFKIGLTAVTQLPSLIPREILANMNTKIILGIEMQPERQAIIDSASQDLSSDSRAIASLDKGEAIITSNFTRFAIPIKIPLFEEYAKKSEKKEKLGFDGIKLN